MNQTELDKLFQDVEELRRAVQRGNPFLRDLLDSRIWSAFTLCYGVFVVIVGIAFQILLSRYGTFSAIPNSVRSILWLSVAAVLVTGGIFKYFFLGHRASAIDKDATIASVARAAYGGKLFHTNVLGLVCLVVPSVFVVSVGKPYFIVPIVAISLAFIMNSMGVIVQRPEYLAAGWYSAISGMAALFFVDSAPFLWIAITHGGMSIVFALAAFLAALKRGTRRRAAEADPSSLGVRE